MDIWKIRILSGGQTGAQRASLDWAIAHDIPHGGWCPAGRLAEDGTIPSRYALMEIPGGGGYRQRYMANVRDSDYTLLVSVTPVLSESSLAITKFADQLRKPWLHVHPDVNWKEKLRDWLTFREIRTLNVAGSRASVEPEVAAFTLEVLDEVLKGVATDTRNKITNDYEHFDSEIEAWIDDQRDPQEARWLSRYALAFNSLVIDPLREALSPGVTYESQSVFDKLIGQESLIQYLDGKLRAIRRSKNRIAAELAEFPGGQPCVAVFQAASELDTNWLDTPLAAMTVRMDPSGLAKSMLMITCVPSPSSAEGTGLFPGCVTPPTIRERRFIRPFPTFRGITLYFYYLDGEIGLDKVMIDTAEYVRQHLEEIKVIEVIHGVIQMGWQRQKVFDAFQFNGFPSVGAMFKGKPFYRHQGLIHGPELMDALEKSAPIYVASR